jgi:hypothetical protein
MGLVRTSKDNFAGALIDYMVGMRISMEDAANVGSSRLAIAALELTPPLVENGGGGLTKGAKDAGFNAVSRDIKSLLVSKDNTKATAVGLSLNSLRYAAISNDQGSFERIRKRATLQRATIINTTTMKIIKDGDPVRAFGKAKNLFSKSNPVTSMGFQDVITDIRAEHLKRRHIDRQGRVRVWRNTGSFLGKHVVENKSIIDEYIKLTQSHVGMLKSGWYEVLTRLPKLNNKALYKDKDVPVWIKRHAGNGYVTVFKNAQGVNMIIGNRIGDNDNQASKNRVHDVARSLAMARLMADLEQFQKRQADKFNGK